MEEPNITMRPNGSISGILVPAGLLQNVSTDGPHLFSRRQESRKNSLIDFVARPLGGSQTLEMDPDSRRQSMRGRTASHSLNNSRLGSTASIGLSQHPPQYTRAKSINFAPQISEKQTIPERALSTVPNDTPANFISQMSEKQAFPPRVPSTIPNDAPINFSRTSPRKATLTVPPPAHSVQHGQTSSRRSTMPQHGSIAESAEEEEITPAPVMSRVSFAPPRDSMAGIGQTPMPRRKSTFHRMSVAVGRAARKVVAPKRKTSIRDTYEKAQAQQGKFQRSRPFQIFFEYSIYLAIVAFLYLVLVGRPLWPGTIWYLFILFKYHLTFIGGTAVFVSMAFFYAFAPLLVFFEHPATLPEPESDENDLARTRSVRWADEPASEGSFSNNKDATALLIPCYKSARLLPATLTAALKVFDAKSIFVLANGNSPTPLDDTADVCAEYGVHHVWVPVGSKIVAQYVGSYIIRSHNFTYSLLIDDDCILPPEFPVVSDRLNKKTRCLGYTLKSIGENRSRGTWCQQAQDLEYKLSGLQRLFAGKIGSATFPHGAIVLWENDFLIETFKHHPGFSVSEDWFFGHVARELGSRIEMCSSVFVETETPANLFFSSRGKERGGFGEMTVFNQRFKRWNFFFVNGAFYNLGYVLFSWKLGWHEIGAKIFVFQEVYETCLYLITPVVLPIMYIVRPDYTGFLFLGTLAMYFINSLIFNELHLRLVGQRVNLLMLICYYTPYKIFLTMINVLSCWWSVWMYASYFARRHPRIIEDTNAVGVVLKIEEEQEQNEGGQLTYNPNTGALLNMPRRPTKAYTRNMSVATARNVMVSAMKVNLTEEAARDGVTKINRRSWRQSMVPPDQIVEEPAEETAGTTRRIKRRSGGARPLSLRTQLTTWRPDWVGSDGEVDMQKFLLRVEEAKEEDEQNDGYTYYGI